MIQRFMLLCALIFSIGIVSAQDTEESTPLIYRDTAPSTDSFTLEVVAEGLRRPLYVTHANDDSGRLFIMEQGGKIFVQGDDQ